MMLLQIERYDCRTCQGTWAAQKMEDEDRAEEDVAGGDDGAPRSVKRKG